MRIFVFAVLMIINSKAAFTGDYYVATTGNNVTGNGSQANPWQTITHVLSQINGTPENPHVIHVAAGTYSPSLTGETFPLNLKSYISLIGAGDTLSILDAETNNGQYDRRIIKCSNIVNVLISYLTIKNGFYSYSSYQNGGGIFIDSSSMIKISNNRIVNNISAQALGGGIFCVNSNHIHIDDNLIKDNISGIGGGIYVQGCVNILISNNSITNNSANYYYEATGGGICLLAGGIIIHNDISYNATISIGGGIGTRGYVPLIIRNNIFNNRTVGNSPEGFDYGGGGIGIIWTSAPPIIGGCINNGNNIYNNVGYRGTGDSLGNQLLQAWSNAKINAMYNYYGTSINPHSNKEVYNNFIVDPYMTSPIEYDTSRLIVVPSPVKFDTMYVDSIKTINATFFNIVNSLYDSIVVTNISFTNPAFTASLVTFTIKAVDRIAVDITFQPDSTGVYNDTMTIATNRGNYKIEVTGTAVPPLSIDDFTNLKSFHLSQNYPNPFNPSTVISYQLPANAKVSVKIYNTLGQEVATLVDKREFAGNHTVQWNGKDRYGNVVSSGMYLYRIDAVSEKGKFVQTKKMVLIK